MPFAAIYLFHNRTTPRRFLLLLVGLFCAVMILGPVETQPTAAQSDEAYCLLLIDGANAQLVDPRDGTKRNFTGQRPRTVLPDKPLRSGDGKWESAFAWAEGPASVERGSLVLTLRNLFDASEPLITVALGDSLIDSEGNILAGRIWSDDSRWLAYYRLIPDPVSSTFTAELGVVGPNEGIQRTVNIPVGRRVRGLVWSPNHTFLAVVVESNDGVFISQFVAPELTASFTSIPRNYIGLPVWYKVGNRFAYQAWADGQMMVGAIYENGVEADFKYSWPAAQPREDSKAFLSWTDNEDTFYFAREGANRGLSTFNIGTGEVAALPTPMLSPISTPSGKPEPAVVISRREATVLGIAQIGQTGVDFLFAEAEARRIEAFGPESWSDNGRFLATYWETRSGKSGLYWHDFQSGRNFNPPDRFDDVQEIIWLPGGQYLVAIVRLGGGFSALAYDSTSGATTILLEGKRNIWISNISATEQGPQVTLWWRTQGTRAARQNFVISGNTEPLPAAEFTNVAKISRGQPEFASPDGLFIVAAINRTGSGQAVQLASSEANTMLVPQTILNAAVWSPGNLLAISHTPARGGPLLQIFDMAGQPLWQESTGTPPPSIAWLPCQ
jgi:hypothetical protein